MVADFARPVGRIRAVMSDDKSDPEKEEAYDGGVAVKEKPTETKMKKLKKALVDSFYGTDHGLKATSETRAEIVELITQLEAKNPNSAPTDALTLLNGKWILALATNWVVEFVIYKLKEMGRLVKKIYHL